MNRKPRAEKLEPTGHRTTFGGEGGPEDKPAAMPELDASANRRFPAPPQIRPKNLQPFRDHVDALKRLANRHFQRHR